ncbi:hypothetical protein IGI37_002103 [Enterococcus sp. AZ194]|uniref:hypothetical protein n=1 Tax=Enterococcus sp. AZ194 TaxID=2774629 RepID=UPI003F23FA4B
MTQQFQQDHELGWDDTITQDSSEGGIVLAPGDYIFEVVKFERARYTPKSSSSKLPPCNMAKIELKIESNQGTATVFNNLYLHTSTEGLLSAFFASIGQKRKGEKLKMNWGLVTGARGVVKIKNRTYNDSIYNDVDRFYPSDPSYYTTKEMPAIVQQLQQGQAQTPPNPYQQSAPSYQTTPAQNYQQPQQQPTTPPVQPQQPQQPQLPGYQAGAF